jgi:hypothetical protein
MADHAEAVQQQHWLHTKSGVQQKLAGQCRRKWTAIARDSIARQESSTAVGTSAGRSGLVGTLMAGASGNKQHCMGPYHVWQVWN